MLDYLRNLTRSAEEKQQEALNAYLDDALSPPERQQFEQQLAGDADLRQAVEERRALQLQMRQMPRRRVPRNFMLDPAVYGRPQRQPLFQLYPAMRVAAVLTAFFFILAISVDLFLPGQGESALMSGAPSQDVALVTEETLDEAAAETTVEAPLAAQAVEVTRVVTEIVVEEGEAAPMAEDASAAAEMMEVPAEEEMAEEAELFAEDSLPVEASPSSQTDTTTNAAEAGDAAEQEPAVAASLPTPSPAPTQTAPAFDATKSTLPRPEEETITSERAMTAVPAPQIEALGGAIEATAVPVPPTSAQPVNGLRLLQIGLGVLLVLLGTAVFYVRRQS